MSRLALLVTVLLLPACGGGGGGSSSSAEGAALHVFLVVEENADFDQVVGNPSMPYLNSLIEEYGLATQYHANAHPSNGNYFMLTTGQLITNRTDYDGIVSDDNLVRRLLEAGKTWKSYAESLPYAGFVEVAFDDGKYASRHNPVVHLSDVHDNPAQAAHVVPFERFAEDLADNAFPSFSFLVPNLAHNHHGGSFSAADTWLKTHLDPLIRSKQFQKDGLLIITFDESEGDDAGGGGRVAWVVVSSKAKRGHSSATFFQHESTLRFILKVLGVTSYPGASAAAPDLDGFLTP